MSDRHEKWVLVEPGTVIPAGQPYRVERHDRGWERAAEYVADGTRTAGAHVDYFIDSSWKPPLVLPTEPTWGIAVGYYSGGHFGKWVRDGRYFEASCAWRPERWQVQDVLDFIPLTDEQVARIENAR